MMWLGSKMRSLSIWKCKWRNILATATIKRRRWWKDCSKGTRMSMVALVRWHSSIQLPIKPLCRHFLLISHRQQVIIQIIQTKTAKKTRSKVREKRKRREMWPNKCINIIQQCLLKIMVGGNTMEKTNKMIMKIPKLYLKSLSIKSSFMLNLMIIWAKSSMKITFS